MRNRQVFSSCDPLRKFKENAKKKFPNCAFFTSPINSPINVGAGFYDEGLVTESIITNGFIALQEKNFSSPIVVWENQVLTLENGASVSIEIQNATFMIAITKYMGQKQVDIHVDEEDRELLQRILDFFYEKQKGLYDTSSIFFTSPTLLTLESIVSGRRQHITFNFSSSGEKEKQYGKSHHRRRH